MQGQQVRNGIQVAKIAAPLMSWSVVRQGLLLPVVLATLDEVALGQRPHYWLHFLLVDVACLVAGTTT